jgi:hypothetical protein
MIHTCMLTQDNLLPQTKHASWYVRLAAVLALSHVADKGDEEVADTAASLSRDAEPAVRDEVCACTHDGCHMSVCMHV